MILGLTGGIATGKSLVSHYFEELGYPVIDADLIAREVVEPASEGLELVREAFGDDIIDKAGKLDRKKLGELIFSDAENRKVLDAIVHPLIWKIIHQDVAKYQAEEHKLIVLDIPLLLESNERDLYDHIMLVYVTPAIQLERLKARNQLSDKEANERIAAQMPLEEKLPLVDTVIDNSGSVAETYQQLDAWLSEERLK